MVVGSVNCVLLMPQRHVPDALLLIVGWLYAVGQMPQVFNVLLFC